MKLIFLLTLKTKVASIKGDIQQRPSHLFTWLRKEMREKKGRKVKKRKTMENKREKRKENREKGRGRAGQQRGKKEKGHGSKEKEEKVSRPGIELHRCNPVKTLYSKIMYKYAQLNEMKTFSYFRDCN